MTILRQFAQAHAAHDRARIDELVLLHLQPRKTDMTAPETYGERSMKTMPMGQNAMQELSELKRLYSELLTKLDAIRWSTTDTDVKRMAAVAITEAETSSMWASKALSRRG